MEYLNDYNDPYAKSPLLASMAACGRTAWNGEYDDTTGDQNWRQMKGTFWTAGFDGSDVPEVNYGLGARYFKEATRDNKGLWPPNFPKFPRRITMRPPYLSNIGNSIAPVLSISAGLRYVAWDTPFDGVEVFACTNSGYDVSLPFSHVGVHLPEPIVARFAFEVHVHMAEGPDEWRIFPVSGSFSFPAGLIPNVNQGTIEAVMDSYPKIPFWINDERLRNFHWVS